MSTPSEIRPGLLGRLSDRLRRAQNAFSNMGVVELVDFLIKSKFAPPKEDFYLKSRYAAFPVKCRAGSSDLDVFRQIYVHREYRCLDRIEEPSLIVDCGANVGFSAVYFLTRYPKARLIAIEPDPGNYAQLVENLKPFADRVDTILAAVWPNAKELVFTDFRDGREWSRSVRESTPGEAGSVAAIDMPGIIERAGVERISLLKIDIEGAEAQLFAENTAVWLGKVDNLVVELHDENCVRIFREAIAPHGFHVEECEELTVCTKPSNRG
jgi:FkbM family methyltransferase